LAGRLKLAGDGHNVCRFAPGDQLGERLEDQPVIRAIKILGADHIANLLPGLRVDQQAAKDGLLGFGRMRWRRGPRIGRLNVSARTQRPSHELRPPAPLRA
jgi:hypothetical protein